MFYKTEILQEDICSEEEISRIKSIIRCCLCNEISFDILNTSTKMSIHYEGEDISDIDFLNHIIYSIEALRNRGFIE